MKESPKIAVEIFNEFRYPEIVHVDKKCLLDFFLKYDLDISKIKDNKLFPFSDFYCTCRRSLMASSLSIKNINKFMDLSALARKIGFNVFTDDFFIPRKIATCCFCGEEINPRHQTKKTAMGLIHEKCNFKPKAIRGRSINEQVKELAKFRLPDVVTFFPIINKVHRKRTGDDIQISKLVRR